MTTKKKILSVSVAAILAVTAIAGTSLAYLTDTDSDVNVMTVGNVKIEQIENFAQDSKLLPAVENEDGSVENAVTKEVKVENVGSEDAYIRTIFAFEDTLDASALIHYDYEAGEINFPADVDNLNWLQIEATNKENPDDVTVYTIGYYTYEDAVEAGETTDESLTSVWLCEVADEKWYDKIGDSYEILVLSQAVQANGFADADTALNEAFGAITADSDDLAAKWFQEVLGEGYTVEAFDFKNGYELDENNVPVALN